jgi:hypothetical protein
VDAACFEQEAEPMTPILQRLVASRGGLDSSTSG